MSDKQREIEIARWKILKPRLDQAYKKHGYREIRDQDMQDYIQVIEKAKAKLSTAPAPAMPCVAFSALSARSGEQGERGHQERVSMAGYVSNEWFALAHTPYSY